MHFHWNWPALVGITVCIGSLALSLGAPLAVSICIASAVLAVVSLALVERV